jgi:hypothetical protein
MNSLFFKKTRHRDGMEYLARLGELAGTAGGFHVTLLLLLRCRGVEAPFFPFFSSRVRVGE